MISIVLLLKIIGEICFVVGWIFMYCRIRRMEERLECLRVHCEAMEETGELAASREKAMEAERRFTEGIANILNYSASTAEGRVPRGEQ